MKTKPERNSIALQCFFLVTRSRLNYRREKQLTKSNLTYSFHDKKNIITITTLKPEMMWNAEFVSLSYFQSSSLPTSPSIDLRTSAILFVGFFSQKNEICMWACRVNKYDRPSTHACRWFLGYINQSQKCHWNSKMQLKQRRSQCAISLRSCNQHIKAGLNFIISSEFFPLNN